MDDRSLFSERRFNLSRLRKAFDQRATRLVAVNFFLREVARRMQAHLDGINLAPKQIMDMGCAIGHDFSILQKKYPNAQLLGLDWSWPMLTQAAQRSWVVKLKQYLYQRRTYFIQADWSYLPIASNSIDLIWSNLALHWATLPNQILEQWIKPLRTNGLIILSTLGPDSLKELRTAFATVDTDAHIPLFIDMHDLGDMLIDQGLSDPVVDTERLTITYETPQSLLKDVRTLGIYPGIDVRPGLRGRIWLQQIYTALDAQRDVDGLIHLSVELIYAHAWKLALPAGHVDKSGVAHLRPEDISHRHKNN